MTTATTKTPAELLAETITRKHAEDLASRIKQPSSQPYIYLSGIHTCPRHLFYLMTEGEKRKPVDAYVQGLFDSGQVQERWVKSKLLDFGLEMEQAQKEVLIPYRGRLKEHHGQLMGKGKVDGIFKFAHPELAAASPRGIQIPGEVKSMDGNMFKRLNTADDLLDYEHTEKYLRQMLMYMYGEELENGVFVLTDCRGHIKPIPIFLHNHLEVAELGLKKMEEAFEGKLLGVAPERISYHHKICGRCDFAPICLPEQVIAGADAIDDPELEATLARHEELKPLAAEFDEIHDNVKDIFKGRPLTTVSGHFEVTVAVQKQRKVDLKQLDADVLAKITTAGEKHVVKVKDLLKP